MSRITAFPRFSVEPSCPPPGTHVFRTDHLELALKYAAFESQHAPMEHFEVYDNEENRVAWTAWRGRLTERKWQPEQPR